MNPAPHRRGRSTLVVATVFLGLTPLADALAQFGSPRIGIRVAQTAHRHRSNAGMSGNVGRSGMGYSNRGMNSNVRQVNHQLVSELRGTMALLHQADHDYNGHRALAIQHLSRAVHALNPNAGQMASNHTGLGNNGTGNRSGNGTGNLNGNATGKGQANKMPQATSDQHLQQALQRLNVIQNQVSNVGSNGHHAQALGHVRSATQELRTALNIR
jgi:hypothetical protein